MIEETKLPRPATAPVTAPKLMEVPKDPGTLPAEPWTMASLVERYGEAGGDEMYCRVACQPGPDGNGCKYFNARADRTFRPDLHP